MTTTVTPKTEAFHDWGFMVSEANGHRSREQVTLTGADFLAGTVLGKVTTGTQTVGAASAGAGNTGNGTVGSLTGDAAIPAGTYNIVFIEPATNLGTFEVFKPDGSLDGTGKVGTAYNGSVNFTIADGSTDFVSGDTFSIAVSYAAGSGKYKAYDPTATDGTQNALAILGHAVFAASADKQGAIVARSAEINKSELVWGAAVTTDQHKTDAYTALAALGIIGR